MAVEERRAGWGPVTITMGERQTEVEHETEPVEYLFKHDEIERARQRVEAHNEEADLAAQELWSVERALFVRAPDLFYADNGRLILDMARVSEVSDQFETLWNGEGVRDCEIEARW